MPAVEAEAKNDVPPCPGCRQARVSPDPPEVLGARRVACGNDSCALYARQRLFGDGRPERAVPTNVGAGRRARYARRNAKRHPRRHAIARVEARDGVTVATLGDGRRVVGVDFGRRSS